jgi:hypothetical protein
MVGETGYNLLTNNCEHFASEVCGFGKSSAQVVVGLGKIFAPVAANLVNHWWKNLNFTVTSRVTGGISAGTGGFSIGFSFPI